MFGVDRLSGQLRLAKHPKDAILREKCRPVENIDAALKQTITQMYQAMNHYQGVGLAAPQVFLNQRLFVYNIGQGPGVLINPEIEDRDGEVTDYEGCLSIPGCEVAVTRSAKVVITGYNKKGKLQRIAASGYLARVFQHELDHLDGVMIIDPEREHRPRTQVDVVERALPAGGGASRKTLALGGVIGALGLLAAHDNGHRNPHKTARR